MRPFDYVTYDLPFRRPGLADIRSRIASICFREKLRLPPQVIDALVEGSHSDIRQIINMISQTKLDQETLDFDQGKQMSKAWEKHVVAQAVGHCQQDPQPRHVCADEHQDAQRQVGAIL